MSHTCTNNGGWVPCVRCGDWVMSEFNATLTEDGWCHDLCLPSYTLFGPMYEGEMEDAA
jgi:hypothetical protein